MRAMTMRGTFIVTWPCIATSLVAAFKYVGFPHVSPAGCANATCDGQVVHPLCHNHDRSAGHHEDAGHFYVVMVLRHPSASRGPQVYGNSTCFASRSCQRGLRCEIRRICAKKMENYGRNDDEDHIYRDLVVYRLIAGCCFQIVWEFHTFHPRTAPSGPERPEVGILTIMEL